MTTVMNPMASVRLRKKAATREAIFRTAIELFTKKGFEKPTIDEIAAQAGTGKGTVYNYFSSKEEILVAFMVEIEEGVQRKIGRFAEAEGPLDTILKDLLHYQFRLKRPYLAFVRVLLSQLIQHSAELREPVERIQEIVDPPLLQIFTRLQERRLIHRSVDIAAAIQSFKLIHFGISCLWAMEGSPFTLSSRAIDEQVPEFARRMQLR